MSNGPPPPPLPCWWPCLWALWAHMEVTVGGTPSNWDLSSTCKGGEMMSTGWWELDYDYYYCCCCLLLLLDGGDGGSMTSSSLSNPPYQQPKGLGGVQHIVEEGIAQLGVQVPAHNNQDSYRGSTDTAALCGPPLLLVLLL